MGYFLYPLNQESLGGDSDIIHQELEWEAKSNHEHKWTGTTFKKMISLEFGLNCDLVKSACLILTQSEN